MASGNDVSLKKMKIVTTGGEHPVRGFTKKKRASMKFLDETIESCKASLGIEKPVSRLKEGNGGYPL